MIRVVHGLIFDYRRFPLALGEEMVKFGICLSLAALALPVSVDDGLFAGGQAEVGRVGWFSKAELEQIGILGLELVKKEKRGRD